MVRQSLYITMSCIFRKVAFLVLLNKLHRVYIYFIDHGKVKSNGRSKKKRFRDNDNGVEGSSNEGKQKKRDSGQSEPASVVSFNGETASETCFKSSDYIPYMVIGAVTSSFNLLN